jgi:threonine aldolase
MRRAIANAEVGDDVYGEDPTVNRLEAMAAERMGKEAAIFVASGTMANQIAIVIWTRPGDEVLLHADAHVIHHENGGAGANAGVNLRPLPGDKGAIDPDALQSYVRPDETYLARTSLVMLENTANMAGGVVVPEARMRALYSRSKDAGLAVHLDGARIFNAAVAAGVSAATFADCSDTVSFCISKGLGAPVGSLLCGSSEKIARARRVRARLGGAWRQAGILAAAGIYSLEHHVERLADDHARAQALAAAIEATGAYGLDHHPETNILYVSPRNESVPGGSRLVTLMAERGVLINATSSTQVRLVTHLDIGDDAIDHTQRIFREIADRA